MANKSAVTIPTSETNLSLECDNDIKDKSSSTDIVSNKENFADREILRHSAGNRRYRENKNKKAKWNYCSAP